MKIHFTKYQGTGNDFIIIEDKNGNIGEQLNQDIIKNLCDRRFGIGADGLLLLQEKEGYDFNMVYYNADGNQSSMCGNGGRCIAHFAMNLGYFDNQARFMAIDGEHQVVWNNTDQLMSLKMSKVSNVIKQNDDFVLNTGSPHLVRFVDQLMDLNVFLEGRKIRNLPEYIQEGINVNFVEVTNDKMWVRTYERGVEDETLSCGTGVTAVAIANSVRQGQNNGQIETHLRVQGGVLRVKFEKKGMEFSEIWLIGPAVPVFSGEFEI